MAKKLLPVVQTAGLCKTFRDFWRRPKVEAVKDLNLEIRPGEVFGLLGPNGSGKSTTIKMLLGLLYPTRGRISLFGKSPTDVAVKSRIGFLPEETYLYPFLVARETLDYYGKLFRLPVSIRQERTEKLLEMVGLKHEAKRRIGEYSKGMARRIGLAQALVNDPEFLILDEPTAGLDPIGTRQMKDVIRALGAKGKTILLSSHVLSDVEDVCDRVTILYGGQQRAAGDIGELLSDRDVTQITTPALSQETLERLRDLVRRLENKDILDVTHPRAKLEDFFLKIVEEAQAARVQTSGARAGGAVPDFLAKATEASTHEIVESLVTASSGSEPLPIEEFKPPEPEVEQSREVIEQLMGTEATPEQEDGEQAREEKADNEGPRPTPRADKRVIDSLIDQADPKENED